MQPCTSMFLPTKIELILFGRFYCFTFFCLAAARKVFEKIQVNFFIRAQKNLKGEIFEAAKI